MDAIRESMYEDEHHSDESLRSNEARSSFMRSGIGNLLSLVSGTAIGAAIMYLFDPAAGRERRGDLGEVAGHALHDAGDTLGSTWETVSTRAGDAARALAGHARDMSEDAADSARDMAKRARKSGGTVASNWLDSARDYVPHFGPEESSVPTIAGVAATALSCLAVGAGAMYLLDPTRGPERRRRLGRQVNSCVNDMGHLARVTGEHLGMRSWMNREDATPDASVASNFNDIPSASGARGPDIGVQPNAANTTGRPVAQGI